MTSHPVHPSNPFAHFIRGVEADVLRALCRNPLFESATTIARESGRSRSEVRVVLNFLASTGIVSVFLDGGRKWYHLNRHHPLHDALMTIMRTEMPRLITKRSSCA